ncbi:MAG: hypothetical protein ACRD59_11925 [Candidatus Acidiferrales bacterium]
MNERLAQGVHFEGALLLGAVFLMTAVGYSGRLRHTPNVAKAAGQEQAAGEQPGFYCNLKAFTVAERAKHGLLSLKIQKAKVETIELENGFAFRFQDGSISMAELAEWVSAERKCCPFFDYEIELQANGGPLWLKLRGKEGVKTFMRSEFRIQ